MAGDTAADAAAGQPADASKPTDTVDKPADKPAVDERTPEQKAADDAAAAVKAKEDAEVARVEAEKAALAAAEVKVDDAKKAVAATQEGPDAQPEGDPAANAALSKAESELKVLTDKRDAELAEAASKAHTAQLNAELDGAGKPKDQALPDDFKLKQEEESSPLDLQPRGPSGSTAGPSESKLCHPDEDAKNRFENQTAAERGPLIISTNVSFNRAQLLAPVYLKPPNSADPLKDEVIYEGYPIPAKAGLSAAGTEATSLTALRAVIGEACSRSSQMRAERALAANPDYPDNMTALERKRFADSIVSNPVHEEEELYPGPNALRPRSRSADAQIGLDSVGTLLAANNVIEDLDLSYEAKNDGSARAPLGDAGAAVVAGAMKTNRTVTRLSLRGNMVGESGATATADALRDNTSITQLDLGSSALWGSNSLGAAGAGALGDVLALSNVTLTSLNVEASVVGPAAVVALCNGLRANRVITDLDIRGNRAGDEGAAAISMLLGSTSQSIHTLHMMANGLTPKGGAAVARALRINMKLEYLDMSDNDLGVATASALKDSLPTNNTLKTLVAYRAQLTDAAGSMIFVGLAENQCLTDLDLSINTLSDGACASLCATLEGTDTLEGKDALGLMNTFDKDESTLLDADEFARLMVARNGGRAVDAARVAEAFSAIDVEHAGTVNLGELEEWMRLGAPDGEQYGHLRDYRAKMLQAFETFDIDDSKTLSKDEFHHAMTEMGSQHMADEAFEAMWQRFDHNGDGSVCYEEFAGHSYSQKAESNSVGAHSHHNARHNNGAGGDSATVSGTGTAAPSGDNTRAGSRAGSHHHHSRGHSRSGHHSGHHSRSGSRAGSRAGATPKPPDFLAYALSGLLHINLHSNQIGRKGVDSIMQALKCNGRVEEIALAYNACTPDAVDEVEKQLRYAAALAGCDSSKMPHKESLRVLPTRADNLTEDGTKLDMSGRAIGALEVKTVLQHAFFELPVSVHDYQQGEDNLESAMGLKKGEQITSCAALCLAGHALGATGAMVLGTELNHSLGAHITWLDLSSASTGNQRGWMEIGSGSSGNLPFSDAAGSAPLKDAGAVALCAGLANNEHLTFLNLAGNQIGAHGGVAIGNMLVKNKVISTLILGRDLALNANTIGPAGAAGLAVALAQSDCGIELLDVSHNGIADQGCLSICDALGGRLVIASKPAFKALVLRGNALTVASCEAIGKVVKAHGAAQLRILDVSENELGPDGLKPIADAMYDHDAACTVEELLAARVGCGCDGAVAVGKMLQCNETLVKLDLLVNGIGDRGATALADGLQACAKGLEHLNLFGNDVTTMGFDHLLEGVSCNGSMKELSLDSNPVPFERMTELYMVLCNLESPA